MDEFVKFNNQTAGRDKFFRLLQYCSRVVWYNLDKNGKNPEAVGRAKKLDETLGLMRRLLRFGRFFDTLHSALPVMSSVSDQVIRITSAISRISSSCFMAIDHLVCLQKLGVLSPKAFDGPSWDKTSTRFWLYSIVMGLVRDFYEISKLYKEASRMKKRKIKGHSQSHAGGHHRPQQQSLESGEGSSSNLVNNGGGSCRGLECIPVQLQPALGKCIRTSRVLITCVVSHADISIDLLKNLTDLFIPLSILGHIKLSPGTIGLLGVVSTVASAIPQINPMTKMVPAT